MIRIGVLEIGEGAARAMQCTLEAVVGEQGPRVRPVAHAPDLASCDAMIIPAWASFARMASEIGEGLREAVLLHAAKGKPVLGLGAGMQLLLDGSDEAPAAPGFGLIAGRSVALAKSIDPMTRGPAPSPHLGWNRLVLEGSSAGAALAPLPQGAWVWFAHRYETVPAEASCVTATADHGGKLVVAAVARGHIAGMQFLPERSGLAGKRILHAVVATWS